VSAATVTPLDLAMARHSDYLCSAKRVMFGPWNRHTFADCPHHDHMLREATNDLRKARVFARIREGQVA
jgi:hypothetical protein